MEPRVFDNVTKKRGLGVDFIDDVTIIGGIRQAQRKPINTNRRKNDVRSSNTEDIQRPISKSNS